MNTLSKTWGYDPVPHPLDPGPYRDSNRTRRGRGPGDGGRERSSTEQPRLRVVWHLAFALCDLRSSVFDPGPPRPRLRLSVRGGNAYDTHNATRTGRRPPAR